MPVSRRTATVVTVAEFEVRRLTELLKSGRGGLVRGFTAHGLLAGIISRLRRVGACSSSQSLDGARRHCGADRTVAVEVALKGSDADRLAGTQVFDAQKDLADPAKVAASAAPIAAYVSAHASVTGTDGKACAPGAAAVVPDGDGVILRNTFSCRNVAGDIVYHSTVLTATDRTAPARSC